MKLRRFIGTLFRLLLERAPFGNVCERLVLKYMPNHAFAVLYNLLLGGDKVRIRKVAGKWQIKCDDLIFTSPTPKCIPQGIDGFEDKFERFFKFEPGETAIDVGACYGDTTVPMAMKVGKTGRVIAVEPEPTNLKYLKMNLAKFDNCEVIDKATWKEKGEVIFHCHPAPTGHSIEPAKGRTRHIKIAADTMDNLFMGQKVDFVKIDVQGTEVDTLLGGQQFLRTVPKLIVETHSRTDPDLRTYPKVIEMVEAMGFKVKFTLDNGLVYAWKPKVQVNCSELSQ